MRRRDRAARRGAPRGRFGRRGVFGIGAEYHSASEDSSEESFRIHAVNQDVFYVNRRCVAELRQRSKRRGKWQEVVSVAGRKLLVTLDTGAECCVLPSALLVALRGDGVKITTQSTKTRLVSYFGEEHRSHALVHLPVSHRAIKLIPHFYVIDAAVAPTLSGDVAEALGLIKRIAQLECSSTDEMAQWKQQFPETFEGVGDIKNFECNLRLKEDYTPVANPCRPIPVAYEGMVKKELERMQKKGVVERVTEPTQFVSNIVVVPKTNGKIRVCLDPTHLNKALLRGPHPMKRLEHISAKLKGAKYFTTLDADEGFWQLRLDKKSSDLCTFITPYGRFRFKKMPYGIVTASDEFQRVTDEIFGGVDGCEVVVDDILVWGRTKEEHDRRVKKVLQRCREAERYFSAVERRDWFSTRRSASSLPRP